MYFITFDSLISGTVGGWAHGYASKGKYYWSDDIETVYAKWSALKNDVGMGLIGAKDKFTV